MCACVFILMFLCAQSSFFFFKFTALRLLFSLCICITHYFIYIANMAERNPAMSNLRTDEYIIVHTGNSSGNTG